MASQKNPVGELYLFLFLSLPWAGVSFFFQDQLKIRYRTGSILTFFENPGSRVSSLDFDNAFPDYRPEFGFFKRIFFSVLKGAPAGNCLFLWGRWSRPPVPRI
ncbi:hypothetical protein X474_03305 [Dethiosulfatarculus sandiegensis]|uniref:Uncharacterized protein n=1 Tax=Dethiosulfatarculus sandiegensis TaxID=1429043 RepID=A0A0D2HYJ4_9BACT|nr:hypothetical protein X474_03305 [Dethiosulfatarculus sandiegensis]